MHTKTGIGLETPKKLISIFFCQYGGGSDEFALAASLILLHSGHVGPCYSLHCSESSRRKVSPCSRTEIRVRAQVERAENLTRWLPLGFSSTCPGVDKIAS